MFNQEKTRKNVSTFCSLSTFKLLRLQLGFLSPKAYEIGVISSFFILYSAFSPVYSKVRPFHLVAQLEQVAVASHTVELMV